MRRWGLVGFVLLSPAWAGAQTETADVYRALTRVVVGTQTIGTTSPLQVVGLPSKASETNCAWIDGSGNFKVGPCGTVTSVGLSLPNIFSVTNSPVTTSGTLTASLATQTGWSVWRVPDGSTAAPAFGALAKGHLPSVTAYRDADIVPTSPMAYSLGTATDPWLSVHAGELRFGTLVAAEEQATIGGLWNVGPTTYLIADVETGDSTIDVAHNNLRSGDRVQMQAAGQYELLAVTSAASTITGGFRYSVTRNLDGTGANAWPVASAVFAGAAQAGEGYVEAHADRASFATGYAGQTVARLPAHYWRFVSSGTVATPTVGALTLPLTARGLWGSGWATGDVGGSLYRDSTVSSDVAATQTGINATLDGTRSITVAFFLAKGGGSAIPTAATIVRTGATSDATAGWRVDSDFTTNTSLRLTIGNGTSRQAVVATSALANDGAWRHYVAVIDRVAGTLALYVNGALATSATLTVTGDFSSTGDALDVLSMDQTNLDELSVWNRALSAADVATLYASRLSVVGQTAAGPTLRGVVRTGSGVADLAQRWAVGQLLGTCGYTTSTFGLVAGDCDATHITADATHGFRVRYGASDLLVADTSGDLSLDGTLTVATGQIVGAGGDLTLDKDGLRLSPGIWSSAGTTYTATASQTYGFAGGLADSVRGLAATDNESNAGTSTILLSNLVPSGTTSPTLYDNQLLLRAGRAGTDARAAAVLSLRGDNITTPSTATLRATVISLLQQDNTSSTVSTIASVAMSAGELRLRASAGVVPNTHGTEHLGTASKQWGRLYLTETGNQTTGAAYWPLVSVLGRVQQKTDGLNATTTCSGGQRVSAITTQYGIVTGVTCS